MCKYYQILRKYIPEYNFYDILDFLRENKISYLNYVKNTKIQLKYKNNNSIQGGDFSSKKSYILNSEYSAFIDEYTDNLNKTQKYINFIKLNAKKDERGDYKEDDHCLVLIIDTKNNSAVIQSLNNYKDCLKCKIGNDEFKIGDVLIRIVLQICKKENIKKIKLTDKSYFLCNGEKIPLIYLRTLTKGEPYYSKFGFTPKYNEDIKAYEYNKKLFLEKSSMTKNELKKIFLYRNFDENNSNDKKMLLHINNIIMPKLKENNIISDVIKIIMECKSNTSCHLLNVIHMSLYHKIGYKEYNDKTFILSL